MSRPPKSHEEKAPDDAKEELAENAEANGVEDEEEAVERYVKDEKSYLRQPGGEKSEE